MIDRAYQRFIEALPNIAVHYAVKCNPNYSVLGRLMSLGCRFEIASLTELYLLMHIGVDPRDVIFSSPVKLQHHITAAAEQGVWRFTADSEREIDKLVQCAPQSAISIRIRTSEDIAPSECMFGADDTQAVALMRYAADSGLQPSGLSFHIGPQALEPAAWTNVIKRCGKIMRALQNQGITLSTLDIGGGFPASYIDPAPSLREYGDAIATAAHDHLPYLVRLIAKPSRALVAEAGIMNTTVIGVTKRNGATWLHLDVSAFDGLAETLKAQNRSRCSVRDMRGSEQKHRYNLTGPSFTRQDTLLLDVPLSEGLDVDDRLLIYSAGAYTTSQASQFSGLDTPEVYCID